MTDNIKKAWDWIQSLLDVDGDCVMLFFTSAVIWKILHGTLTQWDTVAFASAVTCFAWSNKGGKQS